MLLIVFVADERENVGFAALKNVPTAANAKVSCLYIIRPAA
jgi:hypothetical protein